MPRALLLIASCLAAAGCESQHDQLVRRGAAAKAEYRGDRQQDVIAKLGEPASSEEFRLGDGVGEFQLELLNLFPPDDPGTSDTIIREARWQDTGDFLVIWFARADGEWVAVDATVIDRDTQY